MLKKKEQHQLKAKKTINKKETHFRALNIKNKIKLLAKKQQEAELEADEESDKDLK